VPDARLMRMQTRQERSPCRAASRGVVKLREPNAARRKGVQLRRLDFAAVTADVGITHVIGHNQDDVRTTGTGFRRRNGRQKDRNAKQGQQ